jgi:Ca2+-binding EF-hand superfamily protein
MGQNALGRVFERYDRNRNGCLDFSEFDEICKDLGFSTFSASIFSALDGDESGSISYAELVQSLTSAIPTDLDAKSFLTSLVCSLNTSTQSDGDGDVKVAIDTSSWRIAGRDATSVQAELQTILRDSNARVADLIVLFDEDGDPVHVLIDEREFSNAMRRTFGYEGSEQVLRDIFQKLDLDDSGQIGFEEVSATPSPHPRQPLATAGARAHPLPLPLRRPCLPAACSHKSACPSAPALPCARSQLYEFIRGQRHALDTRRRADFELSLQPAEGVRLDDLVWDTKALRVLICDLIERQVKEAEQGPAVLLRAWGCTTGVTRTEWMQKVHESFFASDGQDADLWENEVADVAEQAFGECLRTVVGENFLQRVGLIQLSRWLKGVDSRSAKPTAPLCLGSYTGEMIAALAHGDQRMLKAVAGPRAHEPAAAPPSSKHGRAAVDALPLKSKRQLRAQRQRRTERDRRRAEALMGSRRVDWAARASGGIRAAAASKAAREATALEREAERLISRVSPRSPFVQPRLQRWERDAVHDLQAHPPVLLSSMGPSLRGPSASGTITTSRPTPRGGMSPRGLSSRGLSPRGGGSSRGGDGTSTRTTASRQAPMLPPLPEGLSPRPPARPLLPPPTSQMAERPITGNTSSSPRVLPLRRKHTSSTSLLRQYMEMPSPLVPANEEDTLRNEYAHQMWVLEQVQQSREDALGMYTASANLRSQEGREQSLTIRLMQGLKDKGQI